MGRGNVTDQELADLVERTAEAASALIRGDIRRYLRLIGRNDDYTLMAPSGGEPDVDLTPRTKPLKRLLTVSAPVARRIRRSSSPTRPATAWF